MPGRGANSGDRAAEGELQSGAAAQLQVGQQAGAAAAGGAAVPAGPQPGLQLRKAKPSQNYSSYLQKVVLRSRIKIIHQDKTIPQVQ